MAKQWVVFCSFLIFLGLQGVCLGRETTIKFPPAYCSAGTVLDLGPELTRIRTNLNRCRERVILSADRHFWDPECRNVAKKVAVDLYKQKEFYFILKFIYRMCPPQGVTRNALFRLYEKFNAEFFGYQLKATEQCESLRISFPQRNKVDKSVAFRDARLWECPYVFNITDSGLRFLEKQPIRQEIDEVFSVARAGNTTPRPDGPDEPEECEGTCPIAVNMPICSYTATNLCQSPCTCATSNLQPCSFTTTEKAGFKLGFGDFGLDFTWEKNVVVNTVVPQSASCQYVGPAP